MARRKKGKGEVNFYLLDHKDDAELNTETLDSLLGQNHALFLEMCSPDYSSHTNIERELNRVLKDEDRFSKLDEYFFGNSFWMYILDILSTAKSKGIQRVVCERTLADELVQPDNLISANNMFLQRNLERAMKFMNAFMIMQSEYQKKREKNVSKQISEVSGKTLVIFGAAHTDLVRRVQRLGNKTRIYYPFEGYPQAFATKHDLEFAKTGEFNPDLYIRGMIEQTILMALIEAGYKDNRAMKIACNRYAEEFPKDKFLDYHADVVRSIRRDGTLAKLDDRLQERGLTSIVDYINQS